MHSWTPEDHLQLSPLPRMLTDCRSGTRRVVVRDLGPGGKQGSAGPCRPCLQGRTAQPEARACVECSSACFLSSSLPGTEEYFCYPTQSRLWLELSVSHIHEEGMGESGPQGSEDRSHFFLHCGFAQRNEASGPGRSSPEHGGLWFLLPSDSGSTQSLAATKLTLGGHIRPWYNRARQRWPWGIQCQRPMDTGTDSPGQPLLATAATMTPLQSPAAWLRALGAESSGPGTGCGSEAPLPGGHQQETRRADP